MLRKTALSAVLMGATLLPCAYAMPSVQPTQQAAAQEVVMKVNVNTASAAELSMALTGVGTKRAEAIIELREKLGGFTELNQLMQIKGVGPRLLELNKDRIEF
ncbi:ComEA family DNA-binding protein [Pseudidiomarina terrestris]|uniref:Helix-hairpin-helix domain-containing protein n=1 Tax=Pseudidiomarina terrestris TaxID=2820060 RepID=A0AAW7QZT0_9GAMM|nr:MULTISPECIES: helix-hairpin-helix domain-containing protein [unclassified Pseudidiomarina]MDN7124232.1 helix-hairpin-helix domain-containing protein [Pseudidiomarina sp. 1APP75-32.1]MDN7127299.1 helix-hairpin-helix domain-containing protein [Pseudidiomarina sp. 1APR75-33.1]MDN7128489.1 helix-hairpin-helix domain-containing protein [Pseudidiomarina sp. 1APR75-15]MDN7135263.1 helix-hairpin-helix domain-containing protein [Pseudidiomarina sp. 1ASP75-5]MDN7138678.1 helix-hairpin-helix domain-co